MSTHKKIIYAIGDIHGYLDALEAMQEKIKQDLRSNNIDPKNKDYRVMIIYLGDYIDRGPNAKGVVDNLIAESKKKDGIERIFICGNHDLYLLDFPKDLPVPQCRNWLRYGGKQTLQSYGLEVPDKPGEAFTPSEIERLQIAFNKALPKKHTQFIQGLPFMHIEGDYLFAHAGVNPKQKIKDQTQEDLTFIREPFLSWEGELEKRVVHGHTISKEPDVLDHRIGIDVGVYENGRLGCVVLSDEKPRFLYAKTSHKGFIDPKPIG